MIWHYHPLLMKVLKVEVKMMTLIEKKASSPHGSITPAFGNDNSTYEQSIPADGDDCCNADDEDDDNDNHPLSKQPYRHT
jgi:hypothetical protein